LENQANPPGKKNGGNDFLLERSVSFADKKSGFPGLVSSGTYPRTSSCFAHQSAVDID
jgi:hypothetical protein